MHLTRLVILTVGLFLFPAVPIVVVAGFLLRRRRLLPWFSDMLTLVPFFVWAVAAEFFPMGKSLSNAAIEPFVLGIVVGALHAAFLAWPGEDRRTAVMRFGASILLGSLVALGFTFGFPILVE